MQAFPCEAQRVVRARVCPCRMLCTRATLATRQPLAPIPTAAHAFFSVGHLRDGDPRLPARLRRDGLQGGDVLLGRTRCSRACVSSARGRQGRRADSKDRARCAPARLLAHVCESQGRRAWGRLPDSGRVAPASRLVAAEDARRVADRQARLLKQCGGSASYAPTKTIQPSPKGRHTHTYSSER
eukprot:scaffold104462_cov54-Phaeocystis_antarctica.AAC.1